MIVENKKIKQTQNESKFKKNTKTCTSKKVRIHQPFLMYEISPVNSKFTV
jgi:hypothetical protein